MGTCRTFAAVMALACLIAMPATAAPRSFVDAIIHIESKGKDHLRGKAGEWGRMQIKCATARSVGFKGKCSQLADRATNVRYGTAYLDLALRRAGGNLCHAASLYQSGIFARPRCSAYGRKVLKAMGR